MSYSIVDAHQHFWEPGRFDYPWMTPKVQGLIRPFLPTDLKPILAQEGVDRTIVVQALSSLPEACWLLELASANKFIAGVVTWADLTSPNVAKDLDGLQAHPKFKGIRHQIENEPDDAWMIRKDVLQGFCELERRGIPYELLVGSRHLKYVKPLRERCPRLKLVVDHLAKPHIAEREFDLWAREIEHVSELPDVWCKLSGIITEASWGSWTVDDLRPYVEHVVNKFGYGRVMFGSDWPVCNLAGTYKQVIEALRSIVGPLPDNDARRLWGATASEVYQLD